MRGSRLPPLSSQTQYTPIGPLSPDRGLASVRRTDGWLYPREQGASGPEAAAETGRASGPQAAHRGRRRTLITGRLLGGPGARPGRAPLSLLVPEVLVVPYALEPRTRRPDGRPVRARGLALPGARFKPGRDWSLPPVSPTSPVPVFSFLHGSGEWGLVPRPLAFQATARPAHSSGAVGSHSP